MGQLMINERIKYIEESCIRIKYFQKAILSSSCTIERLRYENAVVQEIDYVLKLIKEAYEDVQGTYKKELSRESRVFTVDELRNYDGTNGKKAYVAVNGTVYDVSNEPTWGGATHFGLVAGNDLSSQFNGCHRLEQILQKLPKVGILK